MATQAAPANSQPIPQPALTHRETLILSLIPLCTRDPSQLQFDWDALAQRLSLKNPRSASNTWITIKKKILAKDVPATSIKLNQREQQFLSNGVLCTKRPLEVDYAVLAEKLSMTNVRSASNAWLALRKKIAGPDAAVASGETGAVTGERKKKEVALGTTKARSKAVARKKAAAQGSSGGTGSGMVAETLAFKVAKPAEQQAMKPDPDAKLCGSPEYHGLNSAHIHALAAVVPSYGMEDRVRVKSEPYGEC